MNKMKIPTANCNFKFSDASEGAFSGYASVFDGVDSFGDRIQKGAFADTIASNEPSPLMLYQHFSSDIIGKWTKFEEDETGLRVEGEFTPGHSLARDVYASAKHGAVSGLSIGFRIPPGGFIENEDSTTTLIKIELREVSVVGFPADKAARITNVKSEIQNLKSFKDFELFLRDSGDFSKSMATAFVSQMKAYVQSDSEGTVDKNAEAQELICKMVSDTSIKF